MPSDGAEKNDRDVRDKPAHPFLKSMEQIHEDETLEDLQIGGLKLIQKKKNFRYGMDAVLLADFADIRPRDTVVDFGTGTGILPLLLIGRGKGQRFTAIEIQGEMTEMARRTMTMNQLDDRVTILQADAADAPGILGNCSVEAVVCNPPYGMPGRSMRNRRPELTMARHQDKETLGRLFTSAFRILKGKGKLFLVYPAAQMFSLMTELRAAHLEPKHFRLVYPDAKHGANLVLMEAVKDARPLLLPMPPLIVCQENGDLTNELKSIYHMQE